jgi:8-oxo-dGTP pyrophosphatase MutT (NUDIX family)
VSAGGVVFRQTGDGPLFALIKAKERWGFPKGNIEKDETPELTALRDISEKTGLPLNRLRIVSRLPPVKYAFRCEGALVNKTVEPWFTPSGARRAIRFKNSRETLDAAIAGLEAGQVAS